MNLQVVPKTAETPSLANPPPISGISVVFDWGGADRGQTTGMFNQADMVDVYGARLCDELDFENVRAEIVNTRKARAKNEAQRFSEVTAGYIPVFLSCDWHKHDRKVNSSTVEFSGERLYKLADALCFSLSEWGNCTVWGHRVLRPIAVDHDREFIRIKPFALNGPNADEYMKRLDKLGQDLGRTIGEYLLSIRQGLRR